MFVVAREEERTAEGRGEDLEMLEVLDEADGLMTSSLLTEPSV